MTEARKAAFCQLPSITRRITSRTATPMTDTSRALVGADQVISSMLWANRLTVG